VDRPVIRVVDYGVCNLGSILNMCRRLGIEALAATSAEEIRSAQRIILPGVGAFDAGMRNLAERGLVESLQQAAIERQVPILGICLGMQLMAQSSSEGRLPGLGWTRAHVKHFKEIASVPTERLKFPHIGWNFLEFAGPHALLAGLTELPRFYFVHSYCVDSAEDETLARATYGGIRFAAMIARHNIVGVQFHPEKSHRFGMRLLSNFAGWRPERP
jgi:imidazole glycerol-phosphate synthase subunit HisH